MEHLLIDHGWLHTKEGQAGAPRLGRPHPWQGGDQVAPRLCLPVGVHDGTPVLAHHLLQQQKKAVGRFTRETKQLAIQVQEADMYTMSIMDHHYETQDGRLESGQLSLLETILLTSLWSHKKWQPADPLRMTAD